MGEYSVGIQTKKNIIDCCKALFYEKGVASTSYEDICAAANVNRGLIPYYFKSKNNISAEIYKEFIFEAESLLSFLRSDDDNLSFILTNALLFELAKRNPNFGKFYSEIESNPVLLDFNLDLQHYVINRLIKFNRLNINPSEVRTMACMSEGVERELVHGIVSAFLNEDVWDIAVKDCQFFFNLIGIDKQTIKKYLSQAKKIYDEYAFQCDSCFNVTLVKRDSL